MRDWAAKYTSMRVRPRLNLLSLKGKIILTIIHHGEGRIANVSYIFVTYQVAFINRNIVKQFE